MSNLKISRSEGVKWQKMFSDAEVFWGATGKNPLNLNKLSQL